MTIVTIEMTEGVSDYALLINAALADPSVTEVRLGAGDFSLLTQIFIPSGKALVGAGREATHLRAEDGFSLVSAQHNGVVNSELGATGITLSDFSIDANKLSPDGLRMNGCFMKQAVDFTISRVDVSNATGYAHFAQGDLNGRTMFASGSYDDCRTFNSQVHFEQMYCDGILVSGCVASDGDADIPTEAYFHPLAGSRNITYVGSSALGEGLSGFSLVSLSTTPPLENIRIIDCHVEIVRGASGYGLSALNFAPIIGLEIVDSTFISRNYIGVSIAGVTGTASGSTFQGRVIGFDIGPSSGGNLSDFAVTDSVALGLADLSRDVGVYGINSGGGLTWTGGVIEARGKPGYMFPLSIGGDREQTVIGADVIVVSSGYDAVLGYVENGGPISLVGSAAIDAAPLPNFAGASVVVDLQSNGTVSDLLQINEADTGLSVVGADIFYQGQHLGQVSGGAQGENLLISLGSSVTANASAALLKALSYSNLSDSPSTAVRALEIVIVRDSETLWRFTSAILVERVADPTLLQIGYSAPDGFVDYQVEDGAVALVSSATLSDADTFHFAGGSLEVELVGGPNGQRLSLENEGDGPGQIGVNGTTVSYAGVAIGSLSTELDGSRMVVSLTIHADQSAVQAVLRAIRYSSPEDTYGQGQRIASLSLSDGIGGLSRSLFVVGADAQGRLQGASGDDRLIGFGGDDLLDGGEGNDRLEGGLGNDLYVVDSALDVIVEAVNAGIDTVQTSLSAYVLGAELENLRFVGVGDFFGTGNAASNQITGGSDNDVLDGGAGADILAGGGGDDVYMVDHEADQVIEAEGEGIDTVRTGLARYVLGANVENVVYLGAALATLEGNGLSNELVAGSGGSLLLGHGGNDVLRGGAGFDTLDGGSGDDVMAGGALNDIYYVDSVGDVVVEEQGGGYDTVRSYLNSYVLPDQVENLSFWGSGDFTGNGNGLGNQIMGASGHDRLYGGAGDDRLIGFGGDDLLDGGEGNDRLEGGLGVDTLSGSQGRDVFIFSPDSTGLGDLADRIMDFESGQDLIDVSQIDSDSGTAGDQAFRFIGPAAFTRTAGELRFERVGEQIVVAGDSSGDGLADFTIILFAPQDLVSTDFIL